MIRQYTSKYVKSDYLILLPILALAFYLSFIPHQNSPYPVHLDEWLHMACSNQIISQGTIIGLVDPFQGGAASLNQIFESGFHLFWAVFHQVSGFSWLDIIRYSPAALFLVTVLSVYILGKRQGFGWEAALFAALITTTTGILGPGFLVPVAMGLLFVALSVFIALNFRGWLACLTIAIFVAFLATMHIVTACILIIFLAPYIFLNLAGNLRHSLGIVLALFAPLIIAFIVFGTIFQSRIIDSWESLFTIRLPLSYIHVPNIVSTYGYLPTALCIIGTFILAMRRGKRNYGLLLGLAILLITLVVFFTLHYGQLWIYYRGVMFSMLFISIAAGAGLNMARSTGLPPRFFGRFKNSLIARNSGNILCVVLISITLAIAIPGRQNTPYYHMIDNEDYQAFTWIKENVERGYERAILDPWKATAFTAIAGRQVYTQLTEYPFKQTDQAYEFLDNGSRDTFFLRENGLSIVYSRGKVLNSDLIEVHKNIYLLKENNLPD